MVLPSLEVRGILKVTKSLSILPLISTALLKARWLRNFSTHHFLDSACFTYAVNTFNNVIKSPSLTCKSQITIKSKKILNTVCTFLVTITSLTALDTVLIIFVPYHFAVNVHHVTDIARDVDATHVVDGDAAQLVAVDAAHLADAATHYNNSTKKIYYNYSTWQDSHTSVTTK